MKLFFVLLISSFVSCTGTSMHQVNKLPISIEIIPEDSKGGYAFLWSDTLCPEFSDSPLFLEERPYELYCYIVNHQNDTLGQYTGLSSPRQFTYFQTKLPTDSIISLHFRVGVNHFSRHLQQQSKRYIEQFNQNNTSPIVFIPISLNINDVLRNKKNLLLERKPPSNTPIND